MPENLDEFRQAVLAWYRTDKRDLPWRRSHDPYRIWVAEVMLQQTQVETVVPYYRRFIERFPTVEDLAAASQQAVLKLWQGLGYYSRARYLHQAARTVCREHGGELPDDEESLRQLAGIGPYTAGAILSLAFGRPVPAVDGNVLRVAARLTVERDDVSRAAVRRRLTETVRDWIPPQEARDFNQGLMELGALVCLPAGPRCPDCPVREHCRGRQQGAQEDLPVTGKRRPPKRVARMVAVIGAPESRQLLIRRRPEEGMLAGMWEFPGITLEQGGAAQDGSERPSQALASAFARRYDLQLQAVRPLASIEHTFSHRIWDMQVFRAECPPAAVPAPDGDTWSWVAPGRLDDFPFAVAHRKIFPHLDDELAALD